MSLQPNMGLLHRMFYVACGVGLMAWGFFVTDKDWAKIALPVLGAVALIEGLVAF